MRCPKCGTDRPEPELFTDEPQYLCRSPVCRHEGPLDDFWTEEDEYIYLTLKAAADRGETDLLQVLQDALRAIEEGTWTGLSC